MNLPRRHRWFVLSTALVVLLVLRDPAYALPVLGLTVASVGLGLYLRRYTGGRTRDGRYEALLDPGGDVPQVVAHQALATFRPNRVWRWLQRTAVSGHLEIGPDLQWRAWWFDRWFGVRDFRVDLVDVLGVTLHPEDAGRASLIIGLRDGERMVLDLSTTKGVAELLERHGVPVGPER